MKYCGACMNVMEIAVEKSEPLYVCGVCGAREELADGAVIFENKRSRALDSRSPRIVASTPTLRRTKDYICPAADCPSHEDPVRKEAVFYRLSPDSFESEYMCTLCFTRFSP